MRLLPAFSVLTLASSSAAIYAPLKEYAGNSFFDDWTYWGFVDNTTWGNVTYLDQADATSQRLTYVDPSGYAIIRVDNTTDIQPAPVVNRPSIRLTSTDTYGEGNLIIIDLSHLPTGCSVWPSFWTLGTGAIWPHAGEIDIIEGINLMENNQMALHADDGCNQALNPAQSGKTIETNCTVDRGCIVAETKPNSFGSNFNSAGGGVFATQIDISGVYIWFWSRPDIPASITTATSTSTIDTSTFGMPSASYPATGCNFTEFFGPQQLVLVTTLCGNWAGVQSIYSSQCPGTCVSNVFGTGNPTYNDAYWNITYIRTYEVQANASSSSVSPLGPTTATAGSNPVTLTTTLNASPSANTAAGDNTGSTKGNGVIRLVHNVVLQAIVGAASLAHVLTTLI